ncbi:HdrB C-terminal domain-containing protein [Sulfurospirillum sp. 1612]|uniref:HdrB C-terminal domain-containing protein n=1 Tax=Sulfurospirillum sp. 1612 TaxID=3094835 RepID=UPI002F94DFE0
MKKYVLFDNIIDINATEPIAISTRELLKFLKVETLTIKELSRDLGSHDMGYDKKGFYVANAKNLALANKEGGAIICAEDSVFLSIQLTIQALRNDAALKSEIDTLLKEQDLELDLDIQINTLADFLVEEIGLSKISKLVKNNFGAFNAAIYLGSSQCQLSQFSTLGSYTDILKTLGAQCISYDLADQSSGYEIKEIKQELAFKMSGSLMLDMFDNAADFVLVNDARSFVMFDQHQRELEKTVGREIDLSIFSLAQLVLLAFGETNREVLGLKYHKIQTKII